MTTVHGRRTGLALSSRTALRAEMPGAAYSTPPGAGTPVWVDAFGVWRQGAVVRVARTRVVVEFVRNGWGDLSERPFALGAVRSRPDADPAADGARTAPGDPGPPGLATTLRVAATLVEEVRDLRCTVTAGPGGRLDLQVHGSGDAERIRVLTLAARAAGAVLGLHCATGLVARVGLPGGHAAELSTVLGEAADAYAGDRRLAELRRMAEAGPGEEGS